jgi:hypothetical protein
MTRLIFPLFFLTLFAYGQQMDAGDNWTQYDDSKFEMIYPSDWSKNTSGEMGMTFVFLSPLASKEDAFRENVNLVVQDLSGMDIDLQAFVEISENQVKTLITNGEILTSERQSSANGECHKLIYTGTHGVYDLRFEQNFWVIGDTAYILTFTCEEDQYDAYKLLSKQILNSFKLK